MKKIIFALILSTSILVSTTSFAETGQSYFGVGYHLGSYDETGFPKANLNGLKIKGGKYISDTVAVEGHYTLGMGSDTVTYLGVDVDIELKYAISAFLKADLPLSETAKIYGLLGFTKAELEASALGTTITEDDSGLSYGFGVDVNITEDILIGGEYIIYLDESNYDYTAFNIGITKLF